MCGNWKEALASSGRDAGFSRRRDPSWDSAIVSSVVLSLLSLKVIAPAACIVVVDRYIQVDQAVGYLDCGREGDVDKGIGEVFDIQEFQRALDICAGELRSLGGDCRGSF